MLDAVEANDLIHNDNTYEDFYIDLNKKIFSVQKLMAGIISNGKFPMYSKVIERIKSIIYTYIFIYIYIYIYIYVCMCI
jgi:hypothetical protein